MQPSFIDQTASRSRRCGNAWLSWLLLTVFRSSAALAADPAEVADKSFLDPAATRQSLLPPLSLPLPPSLHAWDLSAPLDATRELPSAAPLEFRPRRRSTLPPEAGQAAAGASLIGNTSIWQSLSQYRADDRVRVMTLWDTGGSSVALLAGHKGCPTLQWTSRLTSRGGVSHGVLDEFLTRSLGNFGRSMHLGPRNGGGDIAAKSTKASDSTLPPWIAPPK